MRDLLLWQAEAARLDSDKRAFGNEQREARRFLEFDNLDRKMRAAEASKWFSDPAACVTALATRIMRRGRVAMGLPKSESSWPSPRALPTLWAHTAYNAARTYLALRDGRSVDENDLPDAHHYTAAAYADEVVVGDRKFRAIIGECPPPKPRLRTFDEWARGMLDASGGGS